MILCDLVAGILHFPPIDVLVCGMLSVQNDAQKAGANSIDEGSYSSV